MAKFELKKGQSSPQFEKKKNDNSSAKMKEKQKNKLKEKLKSALSNERKPAAASIITEGKSQKITHKIPNKNVALAKATTPKISTESIKHNKANKHGKPSKPNENASRNDKIPHGNKRTNQSDKSDQQPVQKQSNHSKKMKMDKTSAQKNGHVVNNGHPKTDKMNGNKSKKMNKAKPAKQVNQQPIGDKKRNDSIPKASNVSKKKKMKTVGGFIETNADDKELNTVVHDNLTKKKKKKAKNSQNQQENGGTIAKGPAVKVISHEIDNDTANGTNSDSEADSYIDKFFGGNDAFDENRIYSLDEIEAQTENGFLSKISGGSSGSNESSPSEKMTHTKGKKRNSKAKGSPNNKVAVYKQNDEETSDDETDEDSSNYLNMMYGSDSEVSLGSEVSDDGEFADSQSDDSYDSNSTDVDSELMEEYEDDISYEGNSSDMDADDSESSASSDPYDDFLHSRHNSDGSSHEDHDYTDDYDDLRIAQGTASTHQLSEKHAAIFENDSEAMIVELAKRDSDDESAVEAVPIGMTKKELLKIEKERKRAAKILQEQQKSEEEQKRLAYEKSVSDYYNMDNLKAKVEEKYIPLPTISVVHSANEVKCPTIDWLDDGIEETQEDIEFTFPKGNAKSYRVISIESRKDDSATDNQPDSSEMDESLEESSEQESLANEEDSIEGSDAETQTVQRTDLEAQFFNSVNSRHVLLLLRRSLHFHGSLHVKLIAGKATAFGYELQLNKTVTVHSPRGHGLIYLTPSASKAPLHMKAIDHLRNDFYVQDLEYLSAEFNCATDAILLLERDQTNKGVHMIERYMREIMFPNINAFNNESPFYSSEFVLHCKFLNEPPNGLVLNEQWLTLNLAKTSRLITIGGKGVGKSTLVRHLINSNFNKFQKFVFIDLDIGQPELFVPQTLNVTVVTEPILGPGYLRDMKPAKAVFFGDINVLPDPIKYLRCVLKIHEFCTANKELSSLPWVINTMGYSRGFGTELMACILKIFQPTDVVQIQSRMQMENFNHIFNDDVVNDFKFNVFKDEMSCITSKCQFKMHVFNVAHHKKKQAEMNAKDRRYTMILAKLGNCLKSCSDWLTSVKPFEASLDGMTVSVSSRETIDPSDYLDLLNGNLVYLCEKLAGHNEDIADCRGIGIVRSVDTTSNKLYLLSMIPLDELRSVNMLSIGVIPLPSAVLLNQHSQIRGAVPYVYNSDKFVGSKQVAGHIYRPENSRNNKPIRLMEE